MRLSIYACSAEYTSNSLIGFISFNSAQLTNAGSYAVGVTNTLGQAIRLSDAAVLTVLADSGQLTT